MDSHPSHAVSASHLTFGNTLPFVLLAGPCAIESLDHALATASYLKELCGKLGIPFVYKSSFDKANRTSVHAVRGVGLGEGLNILAQVKEKLHCPLVTDVHSPEHCSLAAEVVDILQIPAFLCRQTDLLRAAAETGKTIHIKKGQFLAPWDMKNVVAKMESFGNKNILLCERGVSFGYNTLVSDMRAIPILKSTGYPVVFDATHSVQQPGGQGTGTGGQREYVAPLARAAVSLGIAGVFIETHENPDQAPSDGPNMVRLKDMEELLTDLKAFDELAKKRPLKMFP